jgi:hypothetical protein
MKADPVAPVDSVHLDRFNALRDSMILELNKIKWENNEVIVAER